MSSGATQLTVRSWPSLLSRTSNPRNVAFPLTRVWTLQQGRLAARIDFTRVTPLGDDYGYVLRDSAGAVVESGVAQVSSSVTSLSTIDLVPSGSTQPRRGVYSVVGAEMQIDFGAVGQPRPTSLAEASTYRTQSVRPFRACRCEQLGRYRAQSSSPNPRVQNFALPVSPSLAST